MAVVTVLWDGMVSIFSSPIDSDSTLTGLRLLHRQRVMCDLWRDHVLGIHQACGAEAAGFASASVEDDGIALHLAYAFMYRTFGNSF